MNDWIMFVRAGEMHIDIVIGDQTDVLYPHRNSYLTPHFGFVPAEGVVERRNAERKDGAP